MKVLDHGYVEYITSWGSDEDIIRAARMSTNGGFVSWEPYDGHAKGDLGLLKYLWKNGHHTPFEMAGASFEMQMPIFVARELMRHRSSSFNEASARYAPLPDLNYVPSVERLMSGAGHLTKQAGRVDEAPPLTESKAHEFRSALAESYRRAQQDYEHALSVGVSKELARCLLPVGRYTRLRMQCNLRMWTHFLGLRLDETAQFEIREYAHAISDSLRIHFPRTMQLFDERMSKVA